jgi:hypothetical protein
MEAHIYLADFPLPAFGSLMHFKESNHEKDFPDSLYCFDLRPAVRQCPVGFAG